jgi:glutamyl-tRNA synthetase
MPRLPSTEHLLAVLAIARHGGFTKAARELGLSQSALSRQVMAVEARLGTRLFDRVGKSSAKFDREKLAAFNADAIAGMSTEQFAHAVWILPANHGKLANCGRFADEGDRLFMEFARAYQPRSRTLADPVIQGAFFLADDGAIAYDFEPKNVRKVMAKGEPNGFDTLRELRPMLADLPEDSFGTAAHELIQRLAAGRQMNMGKLAQPLRVAVSGGTVTPPIDATLNILGKHSTLARIDLCLAAAPA